MITIEEQANRNRRGLKGRKKHRINDPVVQCLATEPDLERGFAEEMAAALAKTEQFPLLPNESDVSLFIIVGKRKDKWKSVFVVDPSDYTCSCAKRVICGIPCWDLISALNAVNHFDRIGELVDKR
jgi:hypothetical protein